MQKIQKFQSGRFYAAPKSVKTYELIDRNGHILTFRGRNPKNGDSWKQTATSSFKADASGAFEEVLLSDGTRLRGLRRSPPLGRNPPPGRHVLPRTEEDRPEDAYH